MFDVESIIRGGGILIIMLIIFAESGMLVGFFLPGDTLLFSAGILAASGVLPLWWTIAAITAAAVLGDNVGYQIGKSLGPKLFKKDSLVFRHDYIMRAETFYEKHGSKTMLLAHFVPLVRTFVPVTAGAAKMNRKQYFIYDLIGCSAWAISTTLLGYYLGTKVPGIEKYLEPVLLGIIVLFLAPTLFHVFRDPKIRAAVTNKFRSVFKKAN